MPLHHRCSPFRRGVVIAALGLSLASLAAARTAPAAAAARADGLAPACGLCATHVDAAGLDAIRRHEALRLRPYDDAAGFCTVGYGHLLHRSACGADDHAITREQADALLSGDVTRAEDGVRALLTRCVNQAELDALVDFVFNVGTAALRSSAVLRDVNAGAGGTQIAADLARWVHAGGRVLDGLVLRRAEEAAAFAVGTCFDVVYSGSARFEQTITPVGGESMTVSAALRWRTHDPGLRWISGHAGIVYATREAHIQLSGTTTNSRYRCTQPAALEHPAVAGTLLHGDARGPALELWLSAIDDLAGGSCGAPVLTGVLTVGPAGPTPTMGYFTPLQTMAAHLLVPWRELDGARVGQTLTLQVAGPAAPLAFAADCTSHVGSPCTQQESWAGTVTLTRAR